MKYTILMFSIILLLTSSAIGSDFQASKEFENNPNIILMIGDGMGPEQIRLASLVEYGGENATIMQTQFPFHDLYETNDVNGDVTDSAASGTAIATGMKTQNSRVSMSADKSHSYQTILEYLHYSFGYSTGIVTTTEIMHATPAVFASHTESREDKDEIIAEMLSNNVDLVMGGGLNSSAYVGNVDGAQKLANKYKYELATTKQELNSILATSPEKVLAMFPNHFGETHMPYELERDPDIVPSIVEMTQDAIGYLDNKQSPFFLMVEGGRIDHAGHQSHSSPTLKDAKTADAALETIMFEKAVQAAFQFAKEDGNTIVVVSADHETGGLHIHDFSNLNSTLPSDDRSREENNALRVERALSLNLTWDTTAHTPVLIDFYAFGHTVDYDLVSNTDIFWFINAQLGKFPTIPDYAYLIEGNKISANFTVIDKDKSSTEASLVVELMGGSKVRVNQSLSLTDEKQMISFNEEMSLTVVDAYLEVVDGGGLYNVYSFSYLGELAKQDIVYTTRTSSEQTTPTSDSTRSGLSYNWTIIALIPLFMRRIKHFGR